MGIPSDIAGSECLCRRTGFYTLRRSRKSYLSLKVDVWKVMGERFLWVSPSSSWKHEFYLPKKQNKIQIHRSMWHQSSDHVRGCLHLFTIISDFPIYFSIFWPSIGSSWWFIPVWDPSGCRLLQDVSNRSRPIAWRCKRPPWAILGHFDILLTGIYHVFDQCLSDFSLFFSHWFIKKQHKTNQ